MYLPKSVYKAAPFYWIVVGVLMALLGLRIGQEGGHLFRNFAVALGALSCVWGVRILLVRRSRNTEEAAAAAAQTPTE